MIKPIPRIDFLKSKIKFFSPVRISKERCIFLSKVLWIGLFSMARKAIEVSNVKLALAFLDEFVRGQLFAGTLDSGDVFVNGGLRCLAGCAETENLRYFGVCRAL